MGVSCHNIRCHTSSSPLCNNLSCKRSLHSALNLDLACLTVATCIHAHACFCVSVCVSVCVQVCMCGKPVLCIQYTHSCIQRCEFTFHPFSPLITNKVRGDPHPQNLKQKSFYYIIGIPSPWVTVGNSFLRSPLTSLSYNSRRSNCV